MLEVAPVEDFAVAQRRLGEDFLLASGFVPGVEVPRLAWQLALFLASALLRDLSVDSEVRSQSLRLLELLARSPRTGLGERSRTPLSPLASSRISRKLKN